MNRTTCLRRIANIMFQCPHKIHRSTTTQDDIPYTVVSSITPKRGSHGVVFCGVPAGKSDTKACAVKIMMAPLELEPFLRRADGSVDVKLLEATSDRYHCITPFRIVSAVFPLKQLHAIIHEFIANESADEDSDDDVSSVHSSDSMLTASNYDVDVEMEKMPVWDTTVPWDLKAAVSQLMLLRSTPKNKIYRYMNIYRGIVKNQSLIEGVTCGDFPLPCDGSDDVTGYISVPCIVMPLYCSDLFRFTAVSSPETYRTKLISALGDLYNELYGVYSDSRDIVFIPDCKPANIVVCGRLERIEKRTWYCRNTDIELKLIDVESIRFASYHYSDTTTRELRYAPTKMGNCVGTFTVTVFPSLYNILLQSIVSWVITLEFVMCVMPPKTPKYMRNTSMQKAQREKAIRRHTAQFSLYNTANNQFEKLLQEVFAHTPYDSVADIDAALYYLNWQRYPAILHGVVNGLQKLKTGAAVIKAILPSYTYTQTVSRGSNENDEIIVGLHDGTVSDKKWRIDAISESTMVVFDARLAAAFEVHQALSDRHTSHTNALVLQARKDDIESVLSYAGALRKVKCRL